MDVNTKDSLSRLMDNWNLTKDEKALIEYSNTAVTKEINHSTVLSQLLLAKQVKMSTEETIKSNKLLADAEDTNSKRMLTLTFSLVAVGVLQVIAMIISLIMSYKL